MNGTKEKFHLTAGFMALIVFGLIALEIYVDVCTGVENATTPYQKNVMGWMGGLLGAFSAISVMASSALKTRGKETAFYALGFLSVLLAIYSLLVWISFFCTMWVDYSTVKIEHSTEHQAKMAIVRGLQSDSVVIDSKQSSSGHVTELNKRAASELISKGNCDKLQGDKGKSNKWAKINQCKTLHGANYETVNKELSEINSARQANQNRIDTLKSVAGDNGTDSNSLKDFVMMPLAALMTSSKEDGKNLLLAVAILITVIVSYITNGGLYFVGCLIGDNYDEIKHRTKELIDDVIANNHQSPTPQQPTFKPVQQHPEPIFNRMFVKPQQPVSAEKSQTIKAGHIEDLTEQMYDDTPRPEKGFIGFVDTNALPTNETEKNVLKPKKTDNATVPTEKTENIMSKVVVIGDLGTHCQQCGVQFPKPRTGKRFCNNACRLISWKLENGK